MKDDVRSLSHSKWRSKYHIVFAPKYRRQIIYKQLKADMRSNESQSASLPLAAFDLCRWRTSNDIGGHFFQLSPPLMCRVGKDLLWNDYFVNRSKG